MNAAGRKKTIGDLLLVAAAALLQWTAFVAVRIVAFGRIRRALATSRRRHAQIRIADEAAVRRLAWAVQTSSVVFVPFSSCVTEAIAAVALAKALGYSAALNFGVKPPDASGLAAHAWATSGGLTIVGGETRDWAQLHAARTM